MVTVNQLKCTGCSFCVPACPNQAITSLGMAEVSRERCVECLECIDYCPNKALGPGLKNKESNEG